MKQLVLGCAISMALLGCAATETVVFDIANTSQVAKSYSEVKWLDLEPTRRVNFAIDENNQKYVLPSGPSAIAAFNINTKGKELELEIISHFKKTVFYPNAILLNEDNQVLKVFDSKDFEYKHAYALNGDRLTTEMTIQPVGKQRVKLLIYTTPELVKGESTVIHPVKLDAMARGNYPPDVPNPVIPHSEFGQLTVVAKVDDTIVIEEPTIVANSDAAQQEFKKQLAEQEKQAALQNKGTTLSMAEPSQSERMLTEAQQQFYLSSIKNAVDAGMLDKALALLEEAKALEIPGAQEAFINAVNKK